MKCRFKRSISMICVLLLIISALSLSACGKGSNSIVGTWKAAPGYSLDFLGTGARSLALFEDGSYNITYVTRFGDTRNDSGTYEIIHDGTAIKFRGASSFCYFEFLSNNQMAWTWDGNEYVMERVD